MNASGDNMSSSRYHSEGTIPSKELRRRQIKFSDPVNQLSLETSVRDNLQTCAALHGKSFDSAMSRMDGSTGYSIEACIEDAVAMVVINVNLMN
ncbi:hypothetical protein Pint_34881 [Pistacia integerrima]|uniref:Uncharacterized protein n=1 Tax=Pistacia integerrima TaxID=434235 RepID=A0ACC0Y447_9ROSI|nr:hypothetical protein Pint_34881 [Pistacia integerrima]